MGAVCDVTDEDDVKKTLAKVNSELGATSILVNAAGINKDNLLLKTSRSDINDIISCNLIGTMITCKAAMRYMVKTGGGCIINIGKTSMLIT